MLDDIDRKLLDMLQEDCRQSYAELGIRVGLSVSAVNERLKKLQARGVVRRFAAVVAPEALGLDLCAFVRVLLERPEQETAFLAEMIGQPEVQECHHMTGDYSYMVKIRARDTAHLENILSGKIKAAAGVTRTETLVVLSSPKETMTVDTSDPDRQDTGAKENSS